MASETINPDTIDFILQATKDDPETLLRDVDAMDQKTVQVFAAASVIVGLASLAQTAGGTAATIAFAASLGAYFSAMVGCVWSLFVRDYRRGLYADTLWDDFWSADPSTIKRAIIQESTQAFRENVVILERKAKGLRIALMATAVEASLVGIGVILTRI